jgi:hypothetical protein
VIELGDLFAQRRLGQATSPQSPIDGTSVGSTDSTSSPRPPGQERDASITAVDTVAKVPGL